MKNFSGIVVCTIWIIGIGMLWSAYWKQISLIFVAVDAFVLVSAFFACSFKLVIDVVVSGEHKRPHELPRARVVIR